jgi:hypothetical protein
MALVSPGVQVTIIDQSQYLPAASNSVPLVVLATATNKANAAGTGVAAATTAANANKLYQVTSQRDLVNLFGSPFFYKTTNGTSIHGYELNEYGLLAAYSLLGATNRCYILRADIDLGSLVGTLSRPVGDPEDGTYWLDTTNTSWGIYSFNLSTGKFTQVEPTVITDSQYITGELSDNYPVDSFGIIGSYAVIANPIGTDGVYNQGTFFYKTYDNVWVKVGSPDWKKAIPAVTGTVSFPSLNIGDKFTINVNGDFSRQLNIDTGSITDVKDSLMSLGISDLNVRVVDGKLSIAYGMPGSGKYIALSNDDGTPLTDMGITAGTYYAAEVVYAPSSGMPLWSSQQQKPHPTGSIWIKTSIAGSGMDVKMSSYSATTGTWVSSTVSKYSSAVAAIGDLDSSGGKSIPTGTLFAQVGDASGSVVTPDLGIQLYKRTATGTMVKTGAVSDFVTYPITVGKALVITVTVPGQATTTSNYYTLVTAGTTAESFVTEWNGLDIPNTVATITTSGAIQLEHTAGGDIYLTDIPPGTYTPDSNNTPGQSNGLLAEIGFSATDGTMQVGAVVPFVATNVTQSESSGSGTGAVLTVTNRGTWYGFSVTTNGSGYVVDDTITIDGADIGGASGANDLVLTVESLSPLKLAYLSGTPRVNYSVAASNWEILDYVANEGAPATNPANGTNWFFSTATQVDIMVNQQGSWKGYKNVNFDSDGHPSATGVNSTDPLGPIIATTAPTTQSDGTALVTGDLWLDSSDLENYPKLSRWQLVDGAEQWVAIDNADQTSQAGIVFADARWANSGTVDPVSDPLTSITTLLTSNYLDLDAPDPALYPQGMLLFNTRRSGYNVKQFTTNYFTAAKYPDAYPANDSNPAHVPKLPAYTYTWVSVSGLQSNGAAYMGRKAQRNLVVQAMKAAIGTNQSIREEDTFFNLISAPNYPELQPDMVTLNNDRNNTAYIIGDTPLRLPDQATDLTNWATNAAGATSTGEAGWVTRDEYMGVFYPSGITTDLTGAEVVVPASHMMLRTFLRNDTVAYPWLAPAGTRRGTIDNATNIGYLNGATGEFQTVKNRMSIRDVLYTNQINPLAYFTGIGLLNYGNKNSKDTQSALDRINVARLVCYIRERLQVSSRPFVFEPNDALTRGEITGVVQSLFIDLVAKRGLYDYLVVCDESNNTPARIDRNELWIDVAIEPVKAAEFIYIPVRVMNTGELAATK